MQLLSGVGRALLRCVRAGPRSRASYASVCGFLLLAVTSGDLAGAEALAFERIGEGVELARLEGSGSPPVEGYAVRLDLERVDVFVRSAGPAPARKRVDDLAASLPIHVAINASFFDEDDAAMGRVVSRGEPSGVRRAGSWGALVIEGRRARIVRGDELPTDGPGGDLVLQGLPRLVVGGSVVKLKPQVAARTAVCGEGRSLILVLVRRADTSDFAQFLARDANEGGLGCRDALNLDGGPSTQLSLRWGETSLAVAGGWGVPNALVAVPRAAP